MDRIRAELEAECPPELVLEHPPTVAACVALAADWTGVLTAEALARECVARLRPCGAPQPERVAWRVVSTAAWAGDAAIVPQGWPLPARIYDESLWLAGWGLGIERARRAGYGPLQATAGASRAHAQATAEAARWAHAEPCPWTPLRDLQIAGYWLDALTPDAITLVCPALA